MPARFLRPARGAWLVLVAALAAGPALGADRPATAEGAERLQALFDSFLPKAPGGPLVTAKPAGQSYVVSVDLGVLNGLLAAIDAAASYEPVTLLYSLFEQDGGHWRVVQDSLPKIVSHMGDATSAVEIAHFRQTMIIDPSLAWWLSGEASADKGVMTMRAPKVDETVAFGQLSASAATGVNPDGAVSTSISEEVWDIDFKVSEAQGDGKSPTASGRIEKASFRIGADGLKTRKAFDLATLVSAHRADLAAH